MGDSLERLNSEASFAAPYGVSPIEYSSGRRRTRRLNYGGDRQAKAALHRIVFTRLRHDPRTQAYYERPTQEGKTRREIIRCLKRYAAREAFNLVRSVSHTRVIGASMMGGEPPAGLRDTEVPSHPSAHRRQLSASRGRRGGRGEGPQPPADTGQAAQRGSSAACAAAARTASTAEV